MRPYNVMLDKRGPKAVAKPARQFGHAMQILNHHSFLYKMIVFTVYEHGNICIA
jgi:hypothetical protein